MLSVNRLYSGILQDISFTLAAGGSLALCGPSGSGKSTLLNALAGYRSYRGTIRFSDQRWEGRPAWQRPVRYLNQQLYLFPHFTLLGNLLLAQFAARQSRDRARCLALLRQLDIAHLASCYPRDVSGGEQQRAALARALITAPPLLLLDEPFSSLDWPLRKRLWQNLLALRHQSHTAMIVVTHEPQEAEILSDEVLYLRQGRLSRLSGDIPEPVS